MGWAPVPFFWIAVILGLLLAHELQLDRPCPSPVVQTQPELLAPGYHDEMDRLSERPSREATIGLEMVYLQSPLQTESSAPLVPAQDRALFGPGQWRLSLENPLDDFRRRLE